MVERVSHPEGDPWLPEPTETGLLPGRCPQAPSCEILSLLHLLRHRFQATFFTLGGSPGTQSGQRLIALTRSLPHTPSE